MDQVTAVKRYYDNLESRLGYRYVLGGRKHFGYYPEGERLNFHLALLEMESRLGVGLGLPPGAHVLDGGSGEGLVAIELARVFGLRVTGIDLISRNLVRSRDNARKAARSDDVDFVRADYGMLPFAGAHFDGAYTMETLVHAANAYTVLREFHRVLKPGGRLMLFEYTIPSRSALTPKQSRAIDEVIAGSAMASLPRFVNGTMAEFVGECGFHDVVVHDATDRIMPMLHKFARRAYLPYWIATALRIRHELVNVTAAVHWYRYRDIWRYVIVSATK
jgi:ubiquinone/menaquinone biosynthesis C-methylase UbiE